MKKPAHDPETLTNREQILEREARLRQFGYDSPTAIQFVLAQALPLVGAVLEVGTGKGRFLVELARHVASVTTVDIAAEEQQCARLNARYAGLEERIQFVVQDAACLPWPNATFDAVVTMNAMHHIVNFEQALDEMLRVVKPGGKVVLADFSPRGFQIVARAHRAEGKTHPHEHYDIRELQRVLRKRGLLTRLPPRSAVSQSCRHGSFSVSASRGHSDTKRHGARRGRFGGSLSGVRAGTIGPRRI